jgi:hypothetical protein
LLESVLADLCGGIALALVEKNGACVAKNSGFGRVETGYLRHQENGEFFC